MALGFGLLLIPALAAAVTSTRAVHQDLFHAAMNPTADGQLIIQHGGNAFQLRAYRGQRVRLSDGFTDTSQAYSDPTELYDAFVDLGPPTFCEENAQPQRCTAEGFVDSAGDHACYNVLVFFAQDIATFPIIARRRLFVVVASPRTADAVVEKFEWRSAVEPLATQLHGIEPTVTSDGRLIAFNQFDRLRYSYNATPCAKDGWSTSRYLGAMASDGQLIGQYKLADKPLRAADGQVYDQDDEFHGAYPWLFPDGSAIIYTTAVLPCRVPALPEGCNLLPGPTTCVSFEDPPGCPGRRSALTVIGYPTNWAAAHIDGEVNPARDDFLRLLFSSPGPGAKPFLPLTSGVDVWPFFGGVSQNYTELVFDDGLDGQYAGLWHMNELLTRDGEFDVSRVADSSGYLNTGEVVIRRSPGAGLIPTGGVTLNGRNNAVILPHEASQNPSERLVVDFWLRLPVKLDCDGANNFHPLVVKGDTNVAGYSVVIEQDRLIRARVRVEGETYVAAATLRPTQGEWSRVTFAYEPTNGAMQFWIDDTEAGRFVKPAKPWVPSTQALWVGGPPGSFTACNSGGVLDGEIAELSIGHTFLVPAFRSPSLNNGWLGKALEFDGTGRAFVLVPHAASLNPVNAITLQMAVKPSAVADCDANDNWRVLLSKGDAINGAYSLVLEDDMTVRARFRVAGDKTYDISSNIALRPGVWSRLSATYAASTGNVVFFVDGIETNRVKRSPAQLLGNSAPFVIGGPEHAPGMCNAGDGAFAGVVDEVSVSRIAREPSSEVSLEPGVVVGPSGVTPSGPSATASTSSGIHATAATHKGCALAPGGSAIPLLLLGVLRRLRRRFALV